MTLLLAMYRDRFTYKEMMEVTGLTYNQVYYRVQKELRELQNELCGVNTEEKVSVGENATL